MTSCMVVAPLMLVCLAFNHCAVGEGTAPQNNSANPLREAIELRAKKEHGDVIDSHKKISTSQHSRVNARLHSFLGNFTRSSMAPDRDREYATLVLRAREGIKYRGMKATISIWKPRFREPSGLSIAQLWVYAADEKGGADLVELGWQVMPSAYGNKQPHIFAFMTNDSYTRTKCYNTLCHDTFSITKFGMDFVGKPVLYSVNKDDDDGDHHNGPRLIEAEFKLEMEADGSWYAYLNGVQLGHWPARVLPRLSSGATELEWGGEIGPSRRSDGRHSHIEMGSGFFAGEGEGKAARFKNLQHIKVGTRTEKNLNTDNRYVPPLWNDLIIQDTPNCYELILGRTTEDEVSFYFGGPGGFYEHCT